MSMESAVKKRGRPKKLVPAEAIVILDTVATEIADTPLVSNKPAKGTKSKSKSKSKPTGASPSEAVATRRTIRKSTLATEVDEIAKPRASRTRKPAKTIIVDDQDLVADDAQHESALESTSLSTESQPTPLTTSPVITEDGAASIAIPEELSSIEVTLLDHEAACKSLQQEFHELSSQIEHREALEILHDQVEQLDQFVLNSQTLIRNIQLQKAAAQFADLEALKQKAIQDQLSKSILHETAVVDIVRPETDAPVVQPKAETASSTSTHSPSTASPVNQLQSADHQPSITPMPNPSSTLPPHSKSTSPPSQLSRNSTPTQTPSPSQHRSHLPPTQSSSLPKRPRNPGIPLRAAQPAPPTPPRPTELPLSELKKNPRYRQLSRSVTGLMVGIPALIATSWLMWKSHTRRQMEQRDLIMEQHRSKPVPPVNGGV